MPSSIPPALYGKAKRLQKNFSGNSCETGTLDGFKFSRQVPIGAYIADFVCREQRLIVEVDGATHSTDEELAHDRRRSEFLKSEGYAVIRFQNDESTERDG